MPQKVNVTTSERRGLFYGAFVVLFFATVPVLVRWGEPLSPYGITWGRVLVGHTLYNAALRRAHATYVNLIFNSLLGAAITLTGIAIVLI